MADRRTRRTGHSPDLYRVLRVHPDADEAELKRAFRRQLNRLHPDKRQGDTRAADPDAEERYRLALARLLDAYRVLRDPEQRAAYDAERAARPAGRGHPAPGPESGSRADVTRSPAGERPAGERPARSRAVINLGIVHIEIDINDLR